jgi:hypothetical protein
MKRLVMRHAVASVPFLLSLYVVPGNQDVFAYIVVTACLRAPPSHVDDIPSHQFRLDMRIARYATSSSHQTPFRHQASFRYASPSDWILHCSVETRPPPPPIFIVYVLYKHTGNLPNLGAALEELLASLCSCILPGSFCVSYKTPTSPTSGGRSVGIVRSGT